MRLGDIEYAMRMPNIKLIGIPVKGFSSKGEQRDTQKQYSKLKKKLFKIAEL